MRLTEKTLEVSLCCQISQMLGAVNPIWFGLTQKQERELGFDVATAINRRMIVFQYKASDTVVSTDKLFISPARKFHFPHQQLERLQWLAQEFPSCVYYILPHIGNAAELRANSDLVAQSWAVDVGQLSYPFPPSHRANGVHLVYMRPPHCVITSRPQEVKIIPAADLCKKLRKHPPNSQALGMFLKKQAKFLKGRKLYACVY